jgi:hypothetical protein
MRLRIGDVYKLGHVGQPFRCTVIVQSFSMFTVFHRIISEIMGSTMKRGENVKISYLTNDFLIDKISWNQLTSINEVKLSYTF